LRLFRFLQTYFQDLFDNRRFLTYVYTQPYVIIAYYMIVHKIANFLEILFVINISLVMSLNYKINCFKEYVKTWTLHISYDADSGPVLFSLMSRARKSHLLRTLIGRKEYRIRLICERKRKNDSKLYQDYPLSRAVYIEIENLFVYLAPNLLSFSLARFYRSWCERI
jgi:hypothetical protein